MFKNSLADWNGIMMEYSKYVVGWQSLISGNPALIIGNLDEKKLRYDGPN